MAEIDDFAAWAHEFGGEYTTYVSDDFIDLASILAKDVVESDPEFRQEKSDFATNVLESQYANEISLRKLTIMAVRAMTMERIVLDNVLDRSEEVKPVLASGTALGCTFLRIANRNLEPAFGLQLMEPIILTHNNEPLAQLEHPLFIPFQDLRFRKLI